MFKLDITEIPNYNDGSFKLYKIVQSSDKFPIEKIKKISEDNWYEELSITDKLKYELEQRKQKITLKIRIPQNKKINSLNVLKIGDEFQKVFNTYHFKNKDGYAQTDLTLEEYKNAEVIEDD